MSKVYDSTNIIDNSYLLSQTPPDFVADNYYLKEIQQKLDAEWRFRPNRKLIEEEGDVGSESYSPLEVIIQTVKNEKGEAVSDDWYKLVFRDCRRHNRIGKRFRFAYADSVTDDSLKNIWIGLNQTTLSPTSSQVICRCNGTIGSIYVDTDGTTSYHYEPVIQPSKLNSAGFDFSEVAIDPDGQMVLIAQYNQYTKQYYINERFVIGTDRVYKVSNIIKSDSRTTYKPDDVGIIRIYLAMDQVGDLDDLTQRMAYNGRELEPKPESQTTRNYTLSITEPTALPEIIPDAGLTFQLSLTRDGTAVAGATYTCSIVLEGPQSSLAEISDYCTLTDNGSGNFTLKRKLTAINWQVKVSCTGTVSGADPVNLEFTESLRPF